jgi:dTDP-4-dehydrorhamnose reductase
MKYKILIIGSSGMLGADLSQELYHDHKVFGADLIRRSSFAVSGFYKLDITKKQNVLSVIKNLNPDVVVHTAAWTDVDGCELDPKKAYSINSEGTKNVAHACKAIGATLIYISTDFVFDGKRKNPYKEADKTKPLSIYADSKLKGEAVIKRTLKKYFILRTSWLYGKNGKNFVDTIVEKAAKEKLLKVVDDQVGSPTYTKDLAKAIRILISVIASSSSRASLRIPYSHKIAGRAGFNLPYGTYHVSNSGSVSWYDYAKEILRLAKSETKVLPISSKELDRPAKRPKMSVLDNSKFVKLTGYKIRNWQEALKEYV